MYGGRNAESSAVSISGERLTTELNKINKIITMMADPDILVWIKSKKDPTEIEISRASTIIADRLCGAISDPIIRNAQEKRQLASVEAWLVRCGYKKVEKSVKFDKMELGTFSFRTNVLVTDADGGNKVNIPVDIVIMPKDAKDGDLPLLIEAKSAGDFTNVNKRRKEEAHKMAQLKRTYGSKVRYGLFLCGYFDSGYLGYEAAEGIDWVWEHRIDDLALYNL
jgi:type II restriction enzyme